MRAALSAVSRYVAANGERTGVMLLVFPCLEYVAKDLVRPSITAAP